MASSTLERICCASTLAVSYIITPDSYTSAIALCTKWKKRREDGRNDGREIVVGPQFQRKKMQLLGRKGG